MSKQEQLKAALDWALSHGVQADYDGKSFSDSGCGCCSGSIDPPEELRDVLLEAMRRVRP